MSSSEALLRAALDIMLMLLHKVVQHKNNGNGFRCVLLCFLTGAPTWPLSS